MTRAPGTNGGGGASPEASSIFAELDDLEKTIRHASTPLDQRGRWIIASRIPPAPCVILRLPALFCVLRGSQKRGLARMERLFAVLGPSGAPT